jgi:ClpP class serine protease
MVNLLCGDWLIDHAGLKALDAAAGSIDSLLSREGARPPRTQNLRVREKVGVLDIIGPIFRYENLLTQIFNFPTIESLAADFHRAANNPDLKALILNIDSPGGQVAGINEFAKLIGQSKKKTWAYVGGTAASAAYWLASSADRIVADETAMLGSIGVVYSTRRKTGKDIEIISTTSPDKRPDPGTDHGKRVILKRINALADVFIQAVASNRAISRDKVVALQGDVAIAKRAVSLNLADSVGSLEDSIVEVKKDEPRVKPRPKRPMANQTKSKFGGKTKMLSTEEKQQVVNSMTDHQKQTVKSLFGGQALNTDGSFRKERHPFWMEAQLYSAEHGVSLGEGLKTVALEKPELHQKFLSDIQEANHA